MNIHIKGIEYISRIFRVIFIQSKNYYGKRMVGLV